MTAGGIAQSNNSASFDDLLLAARQAQGTKDYAAAAGYYRRAVALRGDIPELWANLGLMQDATGSYTDAIASFRKAAQLKPSLYVPNLFLGMDYLHVNHAREAIPFLVKAEATLRLRSRLAEPISPSETLRLRAAPIDAPSRSTRRAAPPGTPSASLLSMKSRRMEESSPVKAQTLPTQKRSSPIRSGSS
jgi:tetratricopeptide (TPR) repeat protein